MVTHSFSLRTPPGFAGAGAPAMLQCTTPDFYPEVLAALQHHPERLVAEQVLGAGEGMLYQPVQRVFHLALVDLYCQTHGCPVNPSRLLQAGLVVRRVNGNRLEGWVSERGRRLGWWTLPDPGLDPAAVSRRSAYPHDPVLSRLGQAVRPYDEDTVRLYPAPPAVCAAMGRTVLLGVVPTASADCAEAPGEALTYTPEEVSALLPELWRARTRPLHLSEHPRLVTVTGQDNLLVSRIPPAELEARLGRILEAAQTAETLFGLSQGGPEADALVAALDAVRLHRVLPDDIGAGTFFLEAVRVLVQGQPEALLVPPRWPALTDTQSAAIADAAARALAARASRARPSPQRYKDPEQTYVVQAWARLRDGDCQRLIWSAPTHPFRIAAWYTPPPASVRPVSVSLPPINAATLSQLRPDVAFEVPGEVFSVVRRKAQDLIDGSASGPDKSPMFDWICGFNIPILTTCAFIVLSLFLAVLHLMFWWLPFVKICYPLPRRR